MTRATRCQFDAGAQVDLHEWWLLPSVQFTRFRPAERHSGFWMVSAGWLCVHVWMGSPI